MPAITPMPNPSTSPGPKKETARIAILPDPQPKAAPTVQMKKTQPLVTMPPRRIETAPISLAAVEPEAVVDLDFNPMPLCWVLLGASLVVLLIEIWSYFG
jgi:hypothetical protein